jgi:hypothetical protein
MGFRDALAEAAAHVLDDLLRITSFEVNDQRALTRRNRRGKPDYQCLFCLRKIPTVVIAKVPGPLFLLLSRNVSVGGIARPHDARCPAGRSEMVSWPLQPTIPCTRGAFTCLLSVARGTM